MEMTKEQKASVELEEKGNNTKQEIIDFITKMEIKKYGLRGLDKVDVYVHIQEIVKLYDTYVEEMVEGQRAILEEKHKDEIAELTKQQDEKIEKAKKELAEDHGKQSAKAELVQEELDACKAELETCKRELTTCKEKVGALTREKELAELNAGSSSSQYEIESLKRSLALSESELSRRTEELKRRTEEAARFQVEIERVKRGADQGQSRYRSDGDDGYRSIMGRNYEMEEELKNKDSELRRLRARLEECEAKLNEQVEESKLSILSVPRPSADPYAYVDDIEKILREARTEGQRMIEIARKEVEQEMLKVLNLRARYKHEYEVYRNWTDRIAEEEKAIEGFLTQLSVQYNEANRALTSIQEGIINMSIGQRILGSPELSTTKLDELEQHNLNLD